jgi:cysteine-rich repeat protein
MRDRVRTARAFRVAALLGVAAVWCVSCGDFGDGNDGGLESCGNGEIDAFEDCDGNNLNGATCATATAGRFPAGQLRCDGSCTFDTSRCISQTLPPPDTGPLPYDQCPGERITLTVGERTALRSFSTANVSDDFTPYCAYRAQAADAVFDVRIRHAGTLTVKVVSDGPELVPVIVIRKTEVDAPESCEDSANTLLCNVGSEAPPPPKAPIQDAPVEGGADATGAVDASVGADGGTTPGGSAGARDASVEAGGRTPGGRSSEAAVAVESGQSLALIVDGSSQTAGILSVSLRLDDAACGDGVVNSPVGEECDDGASEDGDGCDHNCKREVPPDDLCSTATNFDAPVPGITQTREGTTAGAADDYAAPCGSKPGGHERVYAFRSVKPGTLNVELSGTFDGVLSLWKTCDTRDQLSGLIACSDGQLASATESLVQDVPGGTYYLVVDGFDARSFGRYELKLGFTNRAP